MVCYAYNYSYPLVNIQKTMERSTMFYGKSTISMAIFQFANC